MIGILGVGILVLVALCILCQWWVATQKKHTAVYDGIYFAGIRCSDYYFDNPEGVAYETKMHCM